MDTYGLTPFEKCPSLDGYHCVTNSLAKLFYHSGHPLSEEMLLGLGAGMGFIYWHPKGGYPVLGGRSNPKGFYGDIGRRTGVRIDVKSTSSDKKAESALVSRMERKVPVMVQGDMGCLPWFDLPDGYHFGGHTFVICGYDGKGTFLASDMDQKAGGLKKGFYYPISSGQLRNARSSPHKPFPPKNAYIETDFKEFRCPTTEDICEAIGQAADMQLNPPIKNIGIKGLRYVAREITKWPEIFDGKALRMNLFNLYVFFEIGGTGGGCFRPMYARFLRESAQITKMGSLLEASDLLTTAGALFTEIGLSFSDIEKMPDIVERIDVASGKLREIADIEERAFEGLRSCV